MNKADNLRNPTSCLNKAAADEPLFILRAKDINAAQAVRHWATMADGNHEAEKIAQALRAADEMDAWRKRNAPPVAHDPRPLCDVLGCNNLARPNGATCTLHHE